MQFNTKLRPECINDAQTKTTNYSYGVKFEIYADVHVSMIVIPESPIGVVALVVSSLAAMVGFMVSRSKFRRLG